MPLTLPTSLSDTEKLNALRKLDQFRQWRSLDDKRYCLVCGKIITGRQIQVSCGTNGNGLQRVSCSTERCNSIPMDWILVTAEILALVEQVAIDEGKVAPRNEANDNVEHGLASRLRDLAVHFKRVS